jgi:hypothetical protein
MRRETAGSEATGPDTAGSARSMATSAGQSPPNATANATSRRILPGSCTARAFRHGVSAADIAVCRHTAPAEDVAWAGAGVSRRE